MIHLFTIELKRCHSFTRGVNKIGSTFSLINKIVKTGKIVPAFFFIEIEATTFIYRLMPLFSTGLTFQKWCFDLKHEDILMKDAVALRLLYGQAHAAVQDGKVY